MDFTFGIITNKLVMDLIENINSIDKQKIPKYEIIIVGGILDNFTHPNVKHIPFDESIKHSWITKKKNLIIENSSFENIVFLHDYILLSDDWYIGQIESGNNFDIRMDVILNGDGTRFRDWCLWPDNQIGDFRTEDLIKSSALLPYEVNNLNKFQYISGSYWVAKKKVMEEYRLNEDLIWGESEDVEWSKRVRTQYNFTMNTKSTVKFKKQKSVVFTHTTNEIISKLVEIL